MDSVELFRAEINRLVAAELAAITRRREYLIRAFIAETGLLPSECELVEQRNGFETVVFVRKRS